LLAKQPASDPHVARFVSGAAFGSVDGPLPAPLSKPGLARSGFAPFETRNAGIDEVAPTPLAALGTRRPVRECRSNRLKTGRLPKARGSSLLETHPPDDVFGRSITWPPSRWPVLWHSHPRAIEEWVRATEAANAGYSCATLLEGHEIAIRAAAAAAAAVVGAPTVWVGSGGCRE
jgi:hypothetical protein